MYNDGSINISYQNGNLRLHCQNSNSENIIGKVKPSCEGFIFGDNEQKRFEFDEEDKEIAWYGSHATDKWIRGCFGRATDKWIKGCFCCVIRNLFTYLNRQEEQDDLI